MRKPADLFLSVHSTGLTNTDHCPCNIGVLWCAVLIRALEDCLLGCDTVKSGVKEASCLQLQDRTVPLYLHGGAKQVPPPPYYRMSHTSQKAILFICHCDLSTTDQIPYLQESRVECPQQDFGCHIRDGPQRDQNTLCPRNQQRTCQSHDALRRGPAMVITSVTGADDNKPSRQLQVQQICSC
jgi:hypothetical protein